MGGLADFSLKDERTDETHVEIDVRAIDAGALVTTPVGNDTQVTAAARYSYAGGLVSLLADGLTIDYWDYQMLVKTGLGAGKLSFLALGSGDRIGVTSDGEDPVRLSLSFHRQAVSYALDEDVWAVSARVTTGVESSNFFENEGDVNIYSIGANGEFVWKPADGFRLRTGVMFASRDYAVNQDKIPVEQRPSGTLSSGLFEDRRALQGAVYADMTFRPVNRMSVVLGARLNHYEVFDQQETHFSPRLTGNVRLSNRWRWQTSVGHLSQPPSLPLPVSGYGDVRLDTTGLQTMWQGDTGFVFEDAGQARPQSLTAKAFVASGQLADVADWEFGDPGFRNYLVRRDARVFGAEILAKKRFSRGLSGLVSYTYSRSDRRQEGGVALPSIWDRRHSLNSALTWKVGSWQIGGRVNYNGGQPRLRNSPAGLVLDRTPQQFRTDLRVEKRWAKRRSSDFADWTLYLDVANVLANKQYASFGTGEVEAFDVPPMPMLGCWGVLKSPAVSG